MTHFLGHIDMKAIIISMVIMLSFIGCGDKEFDGSEDVLNSMIDSLPVEEQVNFIKNLETLVFVAGGENSLMGMTLEDMRSQIRKIHNSNLEFLQKKLNYLTENQKEKVRMLNLNGALTQPKGNDIVESDYISTPKSRYFGEYYTANELKSMIASNGNLVDYEDKNREQAGFVSGCLKNKNVTKVLCECLWNKLATQYAYKEIQNNYQKPTEAFNTFLTVSSQQCVSAIRGQ